MSYHFPHPYAGIMAGLVLSEYRYGLPGAVTTARPRGPFDLRVVRDCEADGAKQEPKGGVQ